MAKNGIFYGATGNGWIKPRIEWSARENIEGNYSDITATLSYTRTNSGYTTYGYWGGSLTIQDDTKTVSGVYLSITEHGYTAAITHTVRVYHTDDGSKTITISATGGITNTTLSYTAISAQVKLEDIPRAATITATDVDIGGVSVVTVGKRSELYTHTVAYRFGELHGYLTGDGLSDSPVHLTRAGLSFPIPEDFYAQIPDAPTGVCTLTCTTYRDEIQVGQAQQTQITLRANPEKCAPLIIARVEDINPNTLALTGDGGKAVRYSSHMQCTMTCQGRFGATILEKKIADIQVQEETLLLQNIDTESVRFWVRDSRGYTTQKVLSPEWIPYYLPTGKLTATRTDATSGNVDLRVEGSWFCGSFGTQKNSLQLRYRINSGSWNHLAVTTDGDTYTASTRLTELAYTHAHKITLEVSDRIHTLELSTQVNPGIPVFDWGSEDFRFRVPVTAPKVTGLSQPVGDSDAVNKAYADGKLSLSGGEMTGTLDMGGCALTGLQEPGESTDAATKQYADGKLSMTLLWENASPQSRFPKQTIPLDLQEYPLVCLLVASHCNWRALICSIADVGNHLLTVDSTKYRSALVTVDGVEFMDAYNNTTADNYYLIPYRIYGLRGC